MTNLVVLGTGYVGLTAAIGFADFGCNVLCLDIDTLKIENLKKGIMPIFENGMKELLDKNVKNDRLHFSNNIETGLRFGNVIFIAVGTPQGDDGAADLTALWSAVESIGNSMDQYKIIVTKSTVPIGTNEKIAEKLHTMTDIEFDVVSNPEFLREGRAMYDFLHPDRVVIGTHSDRPIELIKKIYRPLYLNEVPFVFTDLRTAEMVKYASNCFLATKIAFINEISRLCDVVDANVKTVASTMGKDIRIGSKFLHPSPGYGGSCFPKDTNALAFFAREHGMPLTIVDTVIESNAYQKRYMVEKIEQQMGTLSNKTIAVLGISFKAETDDLRDSPAITIIDRLLELGASVKAFDPQGAGNAKALWRGSITLCEDEYSACQGADALVIATEWNQFRNLNIDKLKRIMNDHHFFDFRNIYHRKDLEMAGFKYCGVGT